MCSNMLGTILWQRKHGRPQTFLQVGTSLNNFKYKRKETTPHEENGPQKEKKASYMKENAQVRGKRHTTYFCSWILNGGGRAPRDSCTCLPPGRP